MSKIVLAVPSKGRLMELTSEVFAKAGLPLVKTGHDRGYHGVIQGTDGVEVAYLSASEIASHLASGRVHLGVTGEDLVREHIADADERVDFHARLGFGHADVIVAVPQCWIDVDSVSDLEDVGAQFYRQHGLRLRAATKYLNLTRRFFAEKGVVSYRIVESLGATEAAPAAGSAEVVVDITSTGATLMANHLKILADGIILKSQANLVGSRSAPWTVRGRETARRIVAEIRAACLKAK
jgi:ATP phosphoribosyltransferase